MYFASLLLAASRCLSQPADTSVFMCRELLGRPTATSVALNLCTNRDTEVFVDFGTSPPLYSGRVSPPLFRAGIPGTVKISPLLPDTRYYYRVCYRTPGDGDTLVREEHSFQTARPRGRMFTFAIQADPHLDTATNVDLYRATLGNILAGRPDFLIDLGDNFMSDKLPVKDLPSVLARHLLLRSFYDTLAHSVPLMLVLGNHEGELGWLLDGTPNNLAILASLTRKSYFPNPLPDGFYSGDTSHADFVGQRGNFYSWEWGDALFVVLDPYWYTVRKPGASKNSWDWTLGERQYRWFEKVLSSSAARLKFVFAHHLVGGNDLEGRGGIEAVPYYEMGGRNADSSWGFDTARPGWGTPLHQLMVRHRVSAFFHGHDHVFVKQELDGIVYQELPQPGYYDFTNPEKSYSNTGVARKYGYTHGTILSSSGYLQVAVTDTGAVVSYVRSYLPQHETAGRRNGEVAYTYGIKPAGTVSASVAVTPKPERLVLHQNYPNPFNPSTVIRYELPSETMVTMAIYDPLGREVAVLVRAPETAGVHEVRWDASRHAAGMYYCRLTAGARTVSRAINLIR